MNELFISVLISQLGLISEEQSKKYCKEQRLNSLVLTLNYLVSTIVTLNESGVTTIDDEVVRTLITRSQLIMNQNQS